jgi:hypothetical protein
MPNDDWQGKERYKNQIIEHLSYLWLNRCLWQKHEDNEALSPTK